MQRTNTWQDAYNTGIAIVDVGDGIKVPLPIEGSPSKAELVESQWNKPTIGGPGRDANDFKTPGFMGVLYGDIPNLPERSVGALEEIGRASCRERVF